MNKKIKNVIVVVMIFLAFFLILVGIFSIFFNKIALNYDQREIYKILEDTKVDKYLEIIFPGIEVGENLLDDIDLVNLIIDDNIIKYTFEYKEIQGGKIQYINFLEYSKLYKEKYNKEVNIKDFEDILSVNIIEKIDDTHFKISYNDIAECTEGNIDTCYFTHPVFFSQEGKITFKNLTNINSVIRGEIVKEILVSGEEYQYSGVFELKYEKNGNKYNILNFVVTKIYT